MTTGEMIAKLRRENGLTQEELAGRLGVTAQAISKWENDVNLPDTEKYASLASALGTSVYALMNPGDVLPEWILKDQMYSETSMFTRLRTISQIEGLHEVNQALYYIRDKHEHQYRKGGLLTKPAGEHREVPYIVHPLLMALHAHALGVRDDALLAAVLLHDVCEDCDVTPEELPFGDEVRTLVRLMTCPSTKGKTPEEKKRIKDAYYEGLKSNGKACVVKVLDRCNNVSTMAHSFTREKLIEYIQETEEYVYPLMKVLKERYLEYNDLYFVLNYHIQSVIETLKNMLERRGW